MESQPNLATVVPGAEQGAKTYLRWIFAIAVLAVLVLAYSIKSAFDSINRPEYQARQFFVAPPDFKLVSFSRTAKGAKMAYAAPTNVAPGTDFNRLIAYSWHYPRSRPLVKPPYRYSYSDDFATMRVEYDSKSQLYRVEVDRRE